MRELTDRILNLLYPDVCFCCGQRKTSPQDSTCVKCRVSLPFTYLHRARRNSFTERFLGRVNLETGASFLYYRKGGSVRKLIYKLKYEGQKDLGVEIGKQYGSELRAAGNYDDVDLILPVPLHPKRRHQRGYNQSDAFAYGLSKSMDVSWDAHGLVRRVHTSTQTRKDKFERLDNTENIFGVRNHSALRGKHILLVDDVLTTGATLEACGRALETVEGVRVSMATIAMAGG